MDRRIFIGWLCKENSGSCSKPLRYAPLFIVRANSTLSPEDTSALIDMVANGGPPDILEYRE